MLIGDIDTRPFPADIDWASCSLYAADAIEAVALLDSVSRDTLQAMGREAATTWRESMTWGRWCGLAMKQLTACAA